MLVFQCFNVGVSLQIVEFANFIIIISIVPMLVFFYLLLV